MHYIFLDTNIFIHFNDFDQIDWASLLYTTDRVVIVIAPIVIDELDKHKYNKNQKIAKRVKRLLPKIANEIENPTDAKYELQLIAKRPSEDVFSNNALIRGEQDDNLLASVIEFRANISDNDRITLVTNDYGPKLKARSLNIETIRPGETHMLTNEPDEVEAKNIALQKELNEFKNKQPVVKLCFENKTQFIAYKKNRPDYTKEQFIEKELNAAKNATPHLYSYSQEFLETRFPIAATAALFGLSKEQITEYNGELDKYYEKYKEYAGQLYAAYNFYNNSIKIEFILINTGTTPATDIDVEIHFPDGFELVDEDGLPKKKKKPEPPYKPKHRHDLGLIMAPLATQPIINRMSEINVNALNPNRPSIKKTNSYNVHYHIESLKHNQYFKLEPLYARFADIGKAIGFEVEYKLIISNLPAPVNGKLNIKFE